ncbi:Hypothetical Protein FCC1311_020022 [Hondaea fermentalgiana]|uniref:Uncharacterized protein n=1 Tax=Hondaea fermentalgiana TaxID=2315210 RepID=A0A2R5GB51_9STRA|nr:Hypothetical Protein FCC1311_020022 [Hondaea fermentalgiana]|eukprot:GBG25783.1 Hypothetical Protein FCC1311_020022 [Hondaea fermentalgiana]
MTNDLTVASVHSEHNDRSVRDEIVAAFTLTLRVSIFAIVGLSQEFYWLARLLVFDLHMGDDPIFVPTTKAGIFVHHATLVLTFGFLPAMLAAYSRMHPLRAFFIFYVPIITWAIVWDLVPLAAIWKLCIPYAYIPLALRIFVVSKRSSLPQKAISFFVSLLLGNMLVIFVNSNDLSKSTVKRILFTSVLVPLIKELTASWFRSSTRNLVTKADAAIGRTNRAVPWAQLLLIQIVWAVYGRMLFSEAEDDTVLTIIVIMQGATEISLRLSIRWRDKKVRTAKRFVHAAMYDRFGLPYPEQHASVLIVPDSNIFREVGTRNRDGIERVFYGMVVLCDMLAEYIAILMVPLIILTFRTRIILIPLNYYSNQFDAATPFQGIDVWPLARWTALQLVTELIVDALCIAYERKHLKIDLERLWSRRPSSFVPWVIFASLGAAPFVYLTLDTDLCADPGKNYCNCANGNGLSSGGLLQKYCEQLYPLTFGIPYNTSATP